VGSIGAMLGEGSAVTVPPTTPELGVVGVEEVRFDSANLDMTDQRRDVVLHVAAVSPDRRLFEVNQVKVSFHELADGCTRTRLSTVVDLRLESTHCLLCLTACFGGCRPGWSPEGSAVAWRLGRFPRTRRLSVLRWARFHAALGALGCTLS
jgi:hypothetical protein